MGKGERDKGVGGREGGGGDGHGDCTYWGCERDFFILLSSTVRQCWWLQYLGGFLAWLFLSFPLLSLLSLPLILPLARRPCATNSHHARDQIIPT